MTGKIKSGQGTLIGNAGEYYVVAELLRNSIIAALAPRNAPAFDVLATKGNKTVKIRVKTKSSNNSGWPYMAKRDGSVFASLSDDNDFTVLVHLGEATQDIRFFILPTAKVDKLLKASFDRWVNSPGKRKEHDPSNRFRKLADDDEIAPYRDQWEILWK